MALHKVAAPAVIMSGRSDERALRRAGAQTSGRSDERANGGNNKTKQTILPKRHDKIVFFCAANKK